MTWCSVMWHTGRRAAQPGVAAYPDRPRPQGAGLRPPPHAISLNLDGPPAVPGADPGAHGPLPRPSGPARADLRAGPRDRPRYLVRSVTLLGRPRIPRL